MFDFALHMRCLQKATEAFFELSQASLAAGMAWQNHLNDELISTVHATTMPPAEAPVDAFTLWQSWIDCWVPPSASHQTSQAPAIWQAWAAPASTAMLAGASAWPSFTANAFWNATPWSFYQGPLTAMMLSYGVPYAVAAPTARASTCAMDAADAAYAQWRSMFGNSVSLASDEPRRRRQRSAYLH